MESAKMAEMLNGIIDSLTEEQKEKYKACKTTEEILELAAREGVELPDEAMDEIAGGGCGTTYECSVCGRIVGKDYKTVYHGMCEYHYNEWWEQEVRKSLST